jgi:RNA-directed DNA polymerase
LRQELLEGRYQPQPVKRVEIPKPDGGTRQLGIPTVVDRFIQQAILQVLTPHYDPTFSPHCYGYRAGKSAHQALAAAREHVTSGCGWVVDLDLEKFFDRINHDLLMGRLAKRIGDRRLLRLIRRYLAACRRCWRTSCWTSWTRSWSNGGIASVAMPTTATSTFGAGGRAHVCWPR